MTSYQEIYKALKPKIKKDFGPACKSFAYGCHACLAHIVINFIEDQALREKEEMKKGKLG